MRGDCVTESGFQVGLDSPRYYEKQVHALMAPFVEAMVGETVRPGDAVLDVACGTGFATRAAALVAGPGARVEGIDLNPAMIACAAEVASGADANIVWSSGSALDLPFADDQFDSVICQQGLQFFPDPVLGLREMVRVARVGARIGLTVWSAPERTPFLRFETAMLSRHGGGAQAEYSTTEQQLRGWFAAAGLDEVLIELVEVEVDLPPVLKYVPEHLKALPWSAGFFALPEEEQRMALDELDAELAEYRTAYGLTIPFSSYLTTASIPA